MVDGEPALLIDPRCRYIIKGFGGRYHYRRLQVPGQDRYTDVPNKNEYSHIHDSLQYASLGATMAPGDISELVASVGSSTNKIL
jgi:hypothetical protein